MKMLGQSCELLFHCVNSMSRDTAPTIHPLTQVSYILTGCIIVTLWSSNATCNPSSTSAGAGTWVELIRKYSANDEP